MIKDRLKEKLVEEKNSLEKQLTIYDQEDPLLSGTTHNLEDNPTEEEGHERIQATRRDLKISLKEVQDALKKIDSGGYGVCENCGKAVGESRLEVLPSAKLCLECEKS